VADQLMAFLNEAASWSENPDRRAPLRSLQPILRAAVLTHPEVRLADEQSRTARLITREAWSAYLPQVSGTFEGGSRHSDAVSKPWTSTPAYDETSQSVGLRARQLLYDFGATGHRVDSFRARESALDARSDAKLSDLALRSLIAWHEVFRARQLVRLGEANRFSRLQILGFVEERETLGASSQSDVLRARARLSDAQAALVATTTRLEAAEALFREAFGSPPPPELPLPTAPEIELARFDDPEPLILIHPAYLEASATYESLRQEALAADAARMPSVYAEWSVSRRDLTGPGVPGIDRFVGLRLQQDLYTGGAQTARRRQAEQRAAEANLEREALRRQIERGLRQAAGEVRYGRALLRARGEAVRVAAGAFESVREQFAFRRGSLLDLLRAQEDLYIAGRDLIDSVIDESITRFRLLHLGQDLIPLLALRTTNPVSTPQSPSRR
jgi:adhesin transport system outer membrane protein